MHNFSILNYFMKTNFLWASIAIPFFCMYHFHTKIKVHADIMYKQCLKMKDDINIKDHTKGQIFSKSFY